MSAPAVVEQITIDAALAAPDGALAVVAPEPCVACETANAAPHWLLCLSCVAVMDEAMLVDLARKHGAYERWCAKADEALREMSADDPRFNTALAMFRLRLRVYERITWLGRAVKSA